MAIDSNPPIRLGEECEIEVGTTANGEFVTATIRRLSILDIEPGWEGTICEQVCYDEFTAWLDAIRERLASGKATPY